MTSIHHFDPSTPETRFGPQVRRTLLTPLPDADRRQLESHLRRSKSVGQPFLTHVLHNKIRSSISCSENIPADVVTGGCRVIYSIDGAPAQSCLLSHRARMGAVSDVIPVSTLLGATLIGMRIGQRAPLLCLDGTVATVSVLGVSRSA